QPSGQRRRRRLSVRARDHDRSRAPEKMFTNRFRQRAVANLPVEDLLELRVAARDRVADDDEIEIPGDVVGRITGERRNLFRCEEVAHRRVDVLIRAAHVVSPALEHRGERRHRGAAYANQVNLHHSTAASSITRRGWAPPITRDCTPNGSVIAGDTVCPDGNPISTGPGKSAKRSAITARAVGSPDVSSHPGSSPVSTAL